MPQPSSTDTGVYQHALKWALNGTARMASGWVEGQVQRRKAGSSPSALTNELVEPYPGKSNEGQDMCILLQVDMSTWNLSETSDFTCLKETHSPTHPPPSSLSLDTAPVCWAAQILGSRHALLSARPAAVPCDLLEGDCFPPLSSPILYGFSRGHLTCWLLG